MDILTKQKNMTVDENYDIENITEPEKYSAKVLSSIEETDAKLQDLYTDMALSEHPESYTENVQRKISSYKRTSNNLLKAYKKTISITDELNVRHRELVKKRKIKILPKAPANSIIDLQESQAEHFARGMNIYKVLLICYIGSFLGVVIEMLWWYLKRGVWASRAGLVFGPFNLLYGAGAVVMSIALYKFRNKGRKLSFIGGFLVGTVVEYACSLFQEIIFGSRSWNYSNKPFNINGRVCLIYSLIWGVLGIYWVKTIYPWITKLILKIPRRVGKIFTWAMFAFLVFNAIVTILATYRWSQPGIENTSAFWGFIEQCFPNERMKVIFPNMKFFK
ncbi:MAG: hypothetical protein E7406_08435 [Ruminococcaceae bacterium]|nr:hypothetical protein [Oscillospiraceae bacterium]